MSTLVTSRATELRPEFAMPSSKSATDAAEVWRGLCRQSVGRLQIVATNIANTKPADVASNVPVAVQHALANNSGTVPFDTVVNAALTHGQLTAVEKATLQTVQQNLCTVSHLVDRCHGINIDLGSQVDAQTMQQNITQYVSTVSEAVTIINPTLNIVFSAVSGTTALSGLPAQAALLSAIESSLNASSSILSSLNAISNLQKQLTNLAEDVVSLVTEFESKMVTVFQSLSSQAESLNGVTVQDMPLVTTEANATTMESGASGYTQWVHHDPAPDSIYLPPAITQGSPQANSDYWQNAGIGSPVGFYYFAQAFAAVDISDGASLPPTNFQPSGSAGANAGSVIQQYSGTAQTGANVAFVLTQSGANYSGSGTANGSINNSISIPASLFSMLPSNLVSSTLVTANVSNPNSMSYNRSTVSGGQVGYLNTSALLNLCSTVMTLAGSFVQTEGYIGVFSSALGPTATYTTLSGAINVIGNITQAVSNAPDQAQQNSQTIASSVTSLLTNFTNQVIPNFRFQF